ncbi:phage upper tail fiber protein [Aedoeadaptatus acetigenes]|uniref:phage upper tail fiber protein n=1 Tax=Aedoeadaptatus acetigenes TaxID=2981723 RepID=UPI0011DE4B2B|nr:hypothetical protein [Aedoeadaptatus acetigenes]MCU6786423.1 hypothetical protein [Aedoeadaptatus acetigenes]
MKEMYKGMVNSPQTKLSKAINSADTDIYVKDGSAFPKGPNLAVIGTDKSAETILYSSVNNDILVGCTRGYQGEAKTWDVNTPIARNFTEADLTAVQENIRTLDEKTLADMTEDSLHRTVSDQEKTSWNNKVDKVDGKALSTNDFTDAAKKKVDAIPPNPKYTDTIQDLSGYVRKEEGKVLSDCNFSGLEKQKLRQLPTENELGAVLEKKADKTELKTKLSEMTDDSTHRLVTDTEKTTWNNKLDSVSGEDVSRSKTKGYENATAWQSVSSSRDVEDWIGDFDKRTRENKEAISNVAKIVVLTESEYKALSNKDQNTIYFVR